MVVDAPQLWSRWQSAQQDRARRFTDSLLDDERSEDGSHWIVKSHLELLRLIGALQFHNQRCSLWFRGENQRFPYARPRRYRTPGLDSAVVDGMKWMVDAAARSPLLRDRSPLARLAILQHYSVDTSLLDVTSSHEVATSFAFLGSDMDEESPDPHIRVFATPRVTDSVNLFLEIGICTVDLVSELPSYCLRPHVQRAAFIADLEAIRSDLGDSMASTAQRADLDDLCIAHINLRGPAHDYPVRIPIREMLFPEPSDSCRHCSPGSLDDLRGDLLFHKLNCLCSTGSPVVGFPS